MKCSWALKPEGSLQHQLNAGVWFSSVKHSPRWMSSLWEDPVLARLKPWCQSKRQLLCWNRTWSLNQFQLIEDEKHYESKAVVCRSSCRVPPVPCKVTSHDYQCWFHENVFSLLSGWQYHAILTALWERDVTMSGECWRSQRLCYKDLLSEWKLFTTQPCSVCEDFVRHLQPNGNRMQPIPPLLPKRCRWTFVSFWKHVNILIKPDKRELLLEVQWVIYSIVC